MTMFKEFKEFAMRGNVIDLAVGVVIGAAFGKIVDSLVKDVIMPPLGFLIGKVDFANLFLTLSEGKIPGPYASLDAAQKAGAVTLNFGVFINTMISFIIVAFAIFLVVKAMNKLKREEPAAAPASPPEDVQLLREIRDLLKK
nr:large conductance mechanosensitive channel protein MscL [Jeongeupia naejangsanensis]